MRVEGPGRHRAGLRAWPARSSHSRVVLSVAALGVVGILLLSSLALTAAGSGRPPTAPAASERRSTVAATPPPPGDPSGGIGVVLSRLDLSSNQSYAGPGVLPVQDNLEQELATYDAGNGDLYVRGGDTNDISVINASRFTNIANVPAPFDNQQTFYVPPVAVDNQTGFVYVTNAGSSSNVSILSGTSQAVTGAIPVGGSPHGIAFDWRNHDFYVADYGTDNVTVVSATTNTSVKSIPVGTDPLAVAYDSASDRVIVTNYGSANVSVIDPATNVVAKSVKVGTDPIAITVDTVDDLIDVLNSPTTGATSVSIFAPVSGSPAEANVTVASYAESFAFDPVQDQLFVAGGIGGLTVVQQPGETVRSTTVRIGDGATDSATAYDARDGDVVISAYEGGGGTGNITVISAASDRAVANVSTNDDPYAVVIDPGTGDAYVVNGGTSSLEPNVTALADTTNVPVASIPLAVNPTGIAYDAAQGSLYAIDSSGNDVYEVNPATDHVAGVDRGGPYPTSTSVSWPVVYDGANGDIYTGDGAVPSVEVFGPSHTLLTTIWVGLYPYAMAYDNVSHLLFVVQDYDGNVSIIDTASNTLLPATLKAGSFGGGLDAIAYDPHSNEVYIANTLNHTVSVWGAVNDTLLRTLVVGATPTSIVVDPDNNTVFVANTGSGNVSVIRDATNTVVRSIPLTDPYLLAYDSGTGSVYNAETGDIVEAFNATTYVPLSGSPLNLGAGGGYIGEGIAYAPTTGDVYLAGSISDALITVGPVPSYSVEFQELGLRQGTPWSVTLNGSERSSISPIIEFTEYAGSYHFTVGPVPGYTSTPTFGAVTVPDLDQPINITFSSELTSTTPAARLYAVYNDRPDLQAAFPDAFANFTNYTELVTWAGGVVTDAFSDSNATDLAPFAYWYALFETYNARPDLQGAFPDAYGNLANYSHLVNWAGGVVTGAFADSADARLSAFGYYYDLIEIYDGRPDLQAAFPDAVSNLTNYTQLVNWAGEVVNSSFADSSAATLRQFGYYFALLYIYDGRSDLQAAFPSAFTDGASYASLLAWAENVVSRTFTDSAYSTLVPFASSY